MSSFEEDVPASPTAPTDLVAAVGFGVFRDWDRRRIPIRHKNKITSNSSSNTAAPTDIPIIAALESFLDLRAGLAGVSDDGDGSGAGKNGEQGGNGPPQRSRFPLNADEGNLLRVAGIEPLRRLLDTLKSTKGCAILGSEP